jgi:hypothetical protein
VTSGSASELELLGISKPSPIARELRCKRCGGGRVSATVLNEFGDEPRLKLFRCAVCELHDLVKA